LVSDEQWDGAERARRSALPILAANVLFPGSMKMTVEFARQRAAYCACVVERAALVGIRTIVFGSAGARNVPEGYDRHRAAEDIDAVCNVLACLGKRAGITFVLEHLRRAECNIINTIQEAMTYVRAVNLPNFQCLVDTYHLWSEHEPLDHVRDAMPWIKHVHLADFEGRVAPGLSGTSDYRPIFAILREGGYDGLISVEALQFDIEKDGRRVLDFVRTQWQNA
jgi:sugar phosphate isomerase/epimerase